MTFDEFRIAAQDRHSGRPFRGMHLRGWRLCNSGDGWQWRHERNPNADLEADLLAEYRVQAPMFEAKKREC